MAVTIIQEPDGRSPASNPIIWTFESDQTTQPNFSFYVELYVSGNLHSAHTVFPEVGNYGKFNASPIMRSLVSTPVIDTAFVQDFGTAMLPTYIIVYEKYGTPPALGSSASASRRLIFNGSLKYQQFYTWVSAIYNIKLTDGALFTTNFPRSQKAYCRYDEEFFLGLFGFRFTFGDTYTLYVELYDINGFSIDSGAINIGWELYWQFNVSPARIESNMGISYANWLLCSYYECYVEYTDGSIINYTEKFRIHFDQDCTRFEPIRLHWLNKFGTYDSFSFDLLSQNSANITSNNYQRQLGQWQGSGSYVFPSTAPQMQHYSKRAVEQMILNSDWIKQDVQHWLVEELYESPRVYVEDRDTFYPVMVTNPSYLKKLRRKEGLIQEIVQLDKTYEYISQLN